MAESCKIVCIGTKGYPGASRVLRDLAGIGLATFCYLEDLKAVPSASIVVFAAWHPSYNALMSKIDAKKFVCWTSPALQTELNDPEIEFLSYVIRHEEISGIWFGDDHLAKTFNERGFYLPYPIDISQIYQYKTENQPKKDVGLFSALQNKQKNVLTQFVAFKMLQQKYADVILHTNRLSPTQRTFATILGIKFAEHGYLPDKEFFTLVQSVKGQSHVFLSESFSYATMESIILGTPCLMSVKVAKNMGIDEPELTVKDVDDSDEIAEKLEQLLTREDYDLFREKVRVLGTDTAEKHNSYLKQHLMEQFDKF